MGIRGLAMTHSFFADDSILFEKAKEEGAIVMKELLLEYEGVSRQMINFEKSLVYFSNNVHGRMKD